MKRNKFSLSNYKLLTCNQGELVPCGLTEVLPGDTIQQATTALIRVSPLLAPVMHPVHARIHHWFVPHRLVWDDWEDFITGGMDGADASVFPTITFGAGVSVGTLGDYLGLPTGVAGISVSALPFRGYAAIWNEWYRDEHLDTELTIDTSDGADSTTNTTLQSVCWEKDYFTSARPWTQLGSEVSLPLGDDAPIVGIGKANQTFPNSSNALYETDGSGTRTYTSGAYIDQSAGANTTFEIEEDPNNAGYPNIRADLSNASGATINDLREAMALQRYAEARARYGARYTEYLRYLGIKSSDARMQRPEYLGGGKQTIQFSEVVQTGVDSGDSGVGELAGHGIAAMRSNRYRRFFEEHGYVFSFLSVKPTTMYSQGIPKTWSRTTKEDFFQKELQHIGAQEVYNKELYAAHTTPDGVFGYQDRYDEYRRQESSIAGDFRGSSALDHWHMGRIFSSDPTLNSTFVKANPTNRIYQSTSEDQLYVMAQHSIQARRLLSKQGTPKLF